MVWMNIVVTNNFVIFKQISLIIGYGTSSDIAIR